MGQDLCLLDIGNTHIRLVLPDGETFYPTQGFDPGVLPIDIPIAAASVVPEIRKKIEACRSDVFWVDCNTPGIPDCIGMEVEKMGADRIANIAHLAADGILPAMTIDCGTAINTEIVDKSGHCCGGVIVPGRHLMREALHMFTALLPVVPMFDSLPATYPGCDTLSNIRWGTDAFSVYGVQGLIEKAKALFPGEKLRVVFCGGDSDFFAKHFPQYENAGLNYTINGVRILYEFSHKKHKSKKKETKK